MVEAAEERRATSTANPTAVTRLGPEQLAAAGRAGEHGLPGAVLVLAGEDVAGHDRGQQRQHPLRGEAQDQQRHREAVLGGEPAEEGVLGRPRLAVDDDHHGDRARAARRSARPRARAWAASLRTSQRSAAPKPARRRRSRPDAAVRGRRRLGVVIACLLRSGESPDAGSVGARVVGEHEEQGLQRGLGRGEAAQLDVGARRASATYAETCGRAPVTTSATLGVALDARPSGCVSRRGAGARASSVVLSRWPGSGAMRAQLGDGAVEGDRAAAHDRDVVADLLDLVHVVGAEQHRQPAARRAASPAPACRGCRPGRGRWRARRAPAACGSRSRLAATPRRWRMP